MFLNLSSDSLTFQLPPTSLVKIRRRTGFDDLGIVSDVLVEAEVFGVVLEVFPHQRVVHEVGVMLGNGVVAVAHHLLARDTETD